jgi:hypothetical protein
MKLEETLARWEVFDFWYGVYLLVMLPPSLLNL